MSEISARRRTVVSHHEDAVCIERPEIFSIVRLYPENDFTENFLHSFHARQTVQKGYNSAIILTPTNDRKFPALRKIPENLKMVEKEI